MKPSTTTAANNASNRFTPAQWFLAVLGVAIAISCSFVLMTDLLPKKVDQTPSAIHAEWKPVVIEQALKAGQVATSAILARF